MKATTLIAGVAMAGLFAGAASTASAASSAYASPSQPVPYSQLNSYMKASPHKRMGMMSGMQTAPTGVPVNTSATTDQPDATQSATPVTPGINNPPAAAPTAGTTVDTPMAPSTENPSGGQAPMAPSATPTPQQ